MSAATEAATAALLGASAHILYFKRGEHHLHGLFYVELFFLSLLVTAGLTRHLADSSVQQGWGRAIFRSLELHFYCLLGLYTSLITYRLFFHPLNKFPGPLDLKMSALSLINRVRCGDAHKRVQNLHSQYGSFVRIGPSAVSIIDPSTVRLVHSADSGFSKGDFYDLLWPSKSLQMMRDKKEHAARRRVWSAAFSDRALRGYEKRTLAYQDKLLSRVADTNGRATNITRWIHAFSTDLTSDLALGKPFGNLDSDKNHWVIDVMDAGPKVLGLMLPAWAFRLLSDIPGLNKDWFRWVFFARDSMMARMKVCCRLSSPSGCGDRVQMGSLLFLCHSTSPKSLTWRRRF